MFFQKFDNLVIPFCLRRLSDSLSIQCPWILIWHYWKKVLLNDLTFSFKKFDLCISGLLILFVILSYLLFLFFLHNKSFSVIFICLHSTDSSMYDIVQSLSKLSILHYVNGEGYHKCKENSVFVYINAIHQLFVGK